ncbi:MAG: MBL fold metallo-hydrolase, partial [Pseudomonadales bacterium]|nr:MBL fold metallo-hydrolase [Pseudomonadales bacterium]
GPDFEGLRVFIFGSSAPLPAPDRAQACVAVRAGNRLYLVDAGAGSARTLSLARIDLSQLRGVLLTHFHSDHIASLPDFNLNSWVAGRPDPLTVYGPVGVSQVVEGFNAAYALDTGYRVAHHGAELLPPELALMQSRIVAPGLVTEEDDLVITAYSADHFPVEPALLYRFDYRGRSVVISGDTLVNDSLIEAATDADLLLQDALSVPIIASLEEATAGNRVSKIFHDIPDYHAPTSDMERLLKATGVQQLALYHLVPPPMNFLLEKVFTRDLPAGVILTEDGMTFDLPAHSNDIIRY